MTMMMVGLWVTLAWQCQPVTMTMTMTMTMAGCPPWRLGRRQMLWEPPRPPAMAYFWSPWQLPISRCPSHTKPWLCRWGQRGDNGGGAVLAPSSTLPGSVAPRGPGTARPRYLRLRLLRLVLRLHQLLVDLLQPGCPDLGGGQRGGWRGLGHPQHHKKMGGRSVSVQGTGCEELVQGVRSWCRV